MARRLPRDGVFRALASRRPPPPFRGTLRTFPGASTPPARALIFSPDSRRPSCSRTLHDDHRRALEEASVETRHLDLVDLVEQGLIRMGAWVPDGRLEPRAVASGARSPAPSTRDGPTPQARRSQRSPTEETNDLVACARDGRLFGFTFPEGRRGLAAGPVSSLSSLRKGRQRARASSPPEEIGLSGLRKAAGPSAGRVVRAKERRSPRRSGDDRGEPAHSRARLRDWPSAVTPGTSASTRPNSRSSSLRPASIAVRQTGAVCAITYEYRVEALIAATLAGARPPPGLVPYPRRFDDQFARATRLR